MKKAYDRIRAKQLVPLLQSVSRELAERLHEIRIIQGRLAVLERTGEGSAELLDLKASLSTHLREVRTIARELKRLGCVLDGNRPGRILIPGIDGDVAHGFAWDLTDPLLRRVSTGAAL